MHDQDQCSINDFCKRFDISRTTFYELKEKYDLPKLTTTPLKPRRKYISQEALEEFNQFIKAKSYVS